MSSALNSLIEKRSMGKSGKETGVNADARIDAAIEAGLIKIDEPPKKKRGRPPTKSPGPSKTEIMTTGEKEVDNQKKINQIINNTKKKRLITQLRAFYLYFPNICREAIDSLVLEELTIPQLQQLYDNFEDTVLMTTELTSIPSSIKSVLTRAETTLTAIGLKNQGHPIAGELVKVQGMASRIESDPDIDKNVKLISVKLAGRLPRNPYLNTIAGMIRCAWDAYNVNCAAEQCQQGEYSNL